MQKCVYILVSVFLISLHVCAQSKRANVWHLSEGLGIDFNCNPPCHFQNGALSKCGSPSSICDKNGNLQFYTNNETIWNKDHRIMENGTGLYSCKWSSQGSLIVPVTTNPNQYYLVTCDNFRFPLNVYTPDYVCSDINPVKNILSLHLIDMSYNNGQGAVLWKNKVIYNGHVEAMLAAVKHANTKDTWLLTYDYNTSSFVSLLLTDCGIQDTVVSTDLGFHVTGGVAPITFSPKGDLFYLRSEFPASGSMIVHFNDSTGESTNPFFVRGAAYRGCFSTDSRYLYSTAKFDLRLPRYDLSLKDTALIFSNMQLTKDTIDDIFINGIQNGPDGKIYYTFDKSYLTWYVIDAPKDNLFSARKDYVPINKPNDTHSTPSANFVQSWFDPDFKEYEYGSPSISYERVCLGNKTTLKATHIPPATSYHWEIQEANTHVTLYYNTDSITHTFSHAGAHTVKLIIDFSCTPDIITRNDIMVDHLPVDYMKDTTICEGSAVNIQAQPAQVSYLWNTGNTTSIQSILPDQLYTVEVTNTCGTKTDSILVTKIEYEVMNLVTQNQDGKNEVLTVESNSTAYGKLSIYNNWGSQIYLADSYKNTWPETDVAAGIYYYRFEISSCKPSNGWVQVVH